MACGACYRRKAKCDGGRPCDRCVRMNRDCGERPRRKGTRAPPVKPPREQPAPKTPVKPKPLVEVDLSRWAKEPVLPEDMVHVLRLAEWGDGRVLAAITSESPGYSPLPLPKVS